MFTSTVAARVSVRWTPPSCAPTWSTPTARSSWSRPTAGRSDASPSRRPVPRACGALGLGALTAYFLRLHRTGRRPDATWETIARSAPALLNRAAELARHARD